MNLMRTNRFCYCSSTTQYSFEVFLFTCVCSDFWILLYTRKGFYPGSVWQANPCKTNLRVTVSWVSLWFTAGQKYGGSIAFVSRTVLTLLFGLVLFYDYWKIIFTGYDIDNRLSYLWLKAEGKKSIGDGRVDQEIKMLLPAPERLEFGC